MKDLQHIWYKKTGTSIFLRPFSALFRVLSAMRRIGYHFGILHRHRLPVPVIVVGNITVGGTGKTPLVAWMAAHFKKQGLKVGVISRGYGGNANYWPQYVRGDSDPAVVGDEPVLIAKRAQCPVAVSPKRIEAAKALLKHAQCDVILSDDGLQHYALMRDIEIVVIDGVRRFGNGYCLPAGPLREPVNRLKTVDFIVCNGLAARDEYAMSLEFSAVKNVRDDSQTQTIQTFRQQAIHAVAGIGHPSRFFSMLKQFGLDVIEHPFPDHHAFSANDLAFDDDLPILMTEKDAVKCARFANENTWYVTVDAMLSDEFATALDARLAPLLKKTDDATARMR